MAYRRFLGFVIAALAISPACPTMATNAPVPVFDCSFGAKRVRVVSVGAVLRYEFGRPSKAEMIVIGDPALGTVRYHRTLFAHSENKQLRFVNGTFSYLLFNRFSTPDYQGMGAEDRSGLVVLKGDHTVARLNCRSGGDFSTTFDFDRLPDDGEDAVPD